MDIRPRHALVTAALTAGLLVCGAPGALASPLPDPGPGPVGGEGGQGVVESAPVAGEGVPTVSADGEMRVSAPSVSGAESSTTSSYTDPANTVPNINGDPCTGAWESVACYAMHFDSPPGVQPRSTLSTSP